MLYDLKSEAANSWFLGIIAAFDQDVFLRFNGGGSKFLIPRRICRLCAWQGSWDQRRRQQILDSKACLLPLRLTGFLRSSAEAANSWFQGVSAAFALGRVLGVYGRGSKFLISWSNCCLCAWQGSWGQRRRQQILASKACLLPSQVSKLINCSINCQPQLPR